MNKQKGWKADDYVMLIVPGSGFEPCVSLSAHHFRIRTTRPGLRKPRAVNFFFKLFFQKKKVIHSRTHFRFQSRF